MKTVYITKPVNLPLLTEELFTAFPEWRKLHDGQYITSVTVTMEGVTFPDETDEVQVMYIIEKRDALKDSVNDRKNKKRKEDKDRAVSKLLNLGLTSDEIEALIGGR